MRTRLRKMGTFMCSRRTVLVRSQFPSHPFTFLFRLQVWKYCNYFESFMFECRLENPITKCSNTKSPKTIKLAPMQAKLVFYKSTCSKCKTFSIWWSIYWKNSTENKIETERKQKKGSCYTHWAIWVKQVGRMGLKDALHLQKYK